MMETTAVSWWSWLPLLLPFIGSPVGDRDRQLLQTARPDVVAYAEWLPHARQPGMMGIGGVLADPEIEVLLATVMPRAAEAQVSPVDSTDPDAPALSDRDQLLAWELASLAGQHHGCFWLVGRPPTGTGLKWDELSMERLCAGALIIRGDNDSPAIGRLLAEIAAEAGWARQDAFAPTLRSEPARPQSAEPTNDLPPPPAPGLRPAQAADRAAASDSSSPTTGAPIEAAQLRLELSTTTPLHLFRRGDDLWLQLAGPYVVVVNGPQELLNETLSRLQQPADSLADVPVYARAERSLAIERPGFYGWCNFRSTTSLISQHMGLRAAPFVAGLALSGLGQIDGIAFQAGATSDRGVTEELWRFCIPAPPVPAGLLAGVSVPPLTSADWARVPATADFVAAFTVDLPTAFAQWRAARGLVGPAINTVVDGAIQGLERQLGFSFEQDLAFAFGTSWIVYDSPDHGGLAMTGLVGTAAVRDPVRARMVVDGLLRLIAASLPRDEREPRYELRTSQFFDRELIMLWSDDPGATPLAPTFCLTETELLFSLYPQPLKSHLRYQAAGVGPWEPPPQPAVQQVGGKANGRANEPNAAVPGGVARWQPDPAFRTTAVLWLDTPRAARGIFGLLPLYGAELSELWQREFGVRWDPAIHPSAAAILPYLRPAEATISVHPTGLWGEVREPAGFSLLAILKWMGSLSSSARVGSPIEPGMAAKPGLPLERTARNAGLNLLLGLSPVPLDAVVPPDVLDQLLEPPDPETQAKLDAQRAAARERAEALREQRRIERELRRRRRP